MRTQYDAEHLGVTGDLFSEKINELLGYFKDSAPFYRTDNFPWIVEQVNYYKIQEAGVDIMCEIADRIRREGKIEDIMELLEELGKVPAKIIQRIRQMISYMQQEQTAATVCPGCGRGKEDEDLLLMVQGIIILRHRQETRDGQM